MDIITTSLIDTIAGVGNGSVIPLGNVLNNKGYTVEGNSIKTRHSVNYVNACFAFDRDVRVVVCNEDDVICSAAGTIIPIAFRAGKGKISFVVECEESVILKGGNVSVFSP